MKRQMRKLTDEGGVTLVELLAAITILSIIVTAFLGFFIQAAKTNQHTNKVNEATFLAQEQMEEIIHKAPAQPKELNPPHPNYKIDIAIEAVGENGLHSVIVTVKDKSESGGETVRAKMETILPLD